MKLTRGAVNLGISDGGIADEWLMQDHVALILDCARVLTKYHNPREHSFTRVAMAPCAPFNVTRHLTIDTDALAGQHHLHTDLEQTRDACNALAVDRSAIRTRAAG